MFKFEHPSLRTRPCIRGSSTTSLHSWKRTIPKLPRRLYEAIAAIEQRLLTPVEPGGAEDMAIRQVQKVLAVIRRKN